MLEQYKHNNCLRLPIEMCLNLDWCIRLNCPNFEDAIWLNRWWTVVTSETLEKIQFERFVLSGWPRFDELLVDDCHQFQLIIIPKSSWNCQIRLIPITLIFCHSIVPSYIGCYFTKCTRDICDELGIRGWVKNSKNGTILGKMQGTKANVDTV